MRDHTVTDTKFKLLINDNWELLLPTRHDVLYICWFGLGVFHEQIVR